MIFRILILENQVQYYILVINNVLLPKYFNIYFKKQQNFKITLVSCNFQLFLYQYINYNNILI